MATDSFETKRMATSKKNLSATVEMTNGFKTLLGSSKASFFELEHKESCSSFPRGHVHKIIVDEATLGRDKKSTILFGNGDSSVSRNHAMIRKVDDHYELVHLSTSNQTLLNGKPIDSATLKSGDEIQLSMGGPKVAFLIPSQNTARSIGFTQRVSLAMDQVVRPYKTTVIAMSVILLLLISGSAYLINNLSADNDRFEGLLSDQELKINEQKDKSQRYFDSMSTQNKKILSDNNQLKNTISKLKKSENEFTPTVTPEMIKEFLPPIDLFSVPGIEQTFDDILFFRLYEIEIVYPDGSHETMETSFTGTGFLTKDGNIVTARHVIEPWNYLSGSDPNPNLTMLNVLENNTTAKIIAHIKVSNKKHSEILLNSNDFNVDKSSDTKTSIDKEDGTKSVIRQASKVKDIAQIKAPKTMNGGLQTDPGLSMRLKPLTNLYIAGYPWGIGEESNPIVSKTEVGSTGLEGGFIITNNRAFDHGNSGGPVFVGSGINSYKVIGVVSAMIGSTGIIIPINYLKR